MSETQYQGIAVIGMAGRFPGAESVEEFWANLVAGRESVSFFTDAELAESGLDAASLRSRGQYVAARGVLKDADCFDAAFFGIHPKEAEVMDPQQRIFLEICWSALERAGYPPNQIRDAVGVFAGSTFNTYYLHALHEQRELLETIGAELVLFGNERDYLTTRVAYKLGLKGPALNVSTACSTSLVAVCQAVQSLLTYQCDIALAGGSSIRFPQKRGYYYDEGNIGSRDGHTRTFDVQSAGTAFSNGVAAVVLKRLEDAVRDGDKVYAVIKGAALNNDGSQRVSFGAPGVEGQSEVIAMAHALADVDPETITYVEAHGTATPLGDAIEIAGLNKAFRLGTDARQFCALGSVKTNVGHLDAAAGVTGLIKTVLALHNKVIPASLHFTQPNPKLDLENTPFYVNAELQPWQAKSGVPRRAGVSSFGTGGTNAHVVLEEAPDLSPSGQARPWQLLLLSAKTPDALDRTTVNLSEHLKRVATQSDGEGALRELGDTAFTLQTGRSTFIHRRIVACESAIDGAAALVGKDPKRVFTQQQKLTNPPVVFMFPGQGAQYAGMGSELYRSEPVFRGEVDRCIELLKPHLETDLRTMMFPAEGCETEAAELLVQTQFTQPALFVIEYALAKLWMSWGIKPSFMIGHSVGEFVAGCLSGVFTLEQALYLVTRRGALVQAQPGGAMLAVRLSEQEVLPLLNSQSAIAAVNSPTLCVVSGPHEAVAELEEQLKPRNITRHLHTSHAFHSPMMEPMIEPFTELLRKMKLGEPQIPYVSNVTARWITPQEAQAPEYWAAHVRQTVRFADGVAELMKDSANILLEVGPGQTLTTLSRQHPARSADQSVLASLPLSGSQELRGILESLGRLWSSGVEVDWQGFYANEQRHKVVLPTYPFERKRYWPESKPSTQSLPSEKVIASISEKPVAPVIEPKVVPQPNVVPQTPQGSSRKERLLATSLSLLQDLSGYDLSSVDPSTDLLELGLDSLLLTQAAQLFHRKFGVSISFRQLMQELSSLSAIVDYVDSQLPPEAQPEPSPVPAVSGQLNQATVSAGGSNVATLEQILLQQQQLTNQVLQLLGRQPVATVAALAAPTQGMVQAAGSQPKSHGPFKPLDKTLVSDLSSTKQAALDSLIARYTQRTAESKKLAANNRPILADPRSVGGFNRLWKEMVYPISTVRSDGSRVWDVDGNEYVDFVMGFGASLFGHRPPFVVEAVHAQLDRGFEIGPIQPLAGEVAALVREMTGMQRVAFTNTGSEAVLAATRVARTVTGRDKVVVFAGAYHGILDEMLFRPRNASGDGSAAAIAPGIPDSALGQVVVLDYGSQQALDFLRIKGSEIAAVLVEPVQSRRLELQPREFLQELRKVTEQTGSALVFDEVVTGFRVHPGGAQAYFNVRADIATYGKVVGGGLPIGLVAGDPRFMDALDGGSWQYGDTSFPEVGVTFFAGTFVRHPLALAAAKAVLTHLKQEGPALQQRLAAETEEAARNLRTVLEDCSAPYHLSQFSSLMHLTFPAEQKLGGLLFYLLRERGIHIYENRAFVVTSAHSKQDFAKLTDALRSSLEEMQEARFIPGHANGEAKPATKSEPVAKVRASQPDAAMAAKVVSAHAGDKFPLTEAQKEIWFAAQMGGNAAVAYNESLNLDFRGAFDIAVFREAARRVIKRHPILLANISSDGQWQQIRENIELELPLIDLSKLTEKARHREFAKLTETEVSEAFDLTTGPLLRVRIVRFSADHHAVIWTAHHIVCDGWSGGLLMSELATIYSALKEGVEPVLEVAASFREYALASESDSAGLQSATEYWKEKLAKLPPPLELPLDHPRPLVRSAKASTARRDLKASLHQDLKLTAGKQRTTMVVLLLAAAKTLLYRLSGQPEVIVGLSAAGQALTENSCLVGHCVNLLPIVTRLEDGASFQSNLAEVKNNFLDAYDHHQCTIGKILQHVSVPRTASRPPLVEVIFNVDKDPSTVKFADLEFECVRNPKRALHFDLFFNFVESPSGLYLECDYNTDLVDAATIERWLHHYEILLESIVADPIGPLGTLPLLSQAEVNELTVARNETGVEFPRQQTLHEWFERQVERTPDAPAVTYEGKHLTYRELNTRANQLSHYLKSLGCRKDGLVGILLDRSFDMVVSILAVLKSGAAYLPIDRVYPKERIAFMLEDSKASLLLTCSKLADDLPSHSAEVICLDTKHSLIKMHAETNPERTATGDDIAYVIYTSGSTGKPKGTLVTHYNVVRLMLATQQWYRFDERDVWTLFHSYAFDFSVWEMWGALLYGGRLVIVPYLISRSPEDFYELLLAERVTVLNQTPSAFKMLMQAEIRRGPSQDLALRYVIFGGEALEMQTLADWFVRHGDQKPRLVNMYGITETTVHVSYRPLTIADVNAGSVIGVPIPDLQIYILDQHRNPVPVGVIGEMYIGGAGVAAGYLNREELTQERFIADTFTDKPGRLLYRSGDLARYLPGKDIEYCGRIDSQVKVRGFRIELGEIESVLLRNQAVRNCVVLAKDDGSGDKRLLAYVEFEPGLSGDPRDLRSELLKQLPDYMVPSVFIPILAMPLTPNGKVDFKALPSPDDSRLEAAGGFVAPQKPVEQMLAGIWSKILRVKRVGLNDNFFELGGHSLLALRIIMEMEKIFNKRLPLATLLAAPTVGGLAEVICKEDWQPSWSSLVPIQPNGTKPPLFLFHSHGGNVLEYQLLAKHLDSDQPVYGIQAHGLDGRIAKDRSLEEMVGTYLEEVKRMQPQGPYFLAGFCFGGLLAYEAAQQLSRQGEDVAFLAMIQTMHPAFSLFRSDITPLRRWWYRISKRIDLERDNFVYRGVAYIPERARRSWDVGRAKATIAFDRFIGNGNNGRKRSSMPYILESLAIEHDRAFESYKPKPYAGDVVLFRTSKQLSGILANETLGWDQYVEGVLDVCEVSGHQQNMLLEPNVLSLVVELESRLVAAQHPISAVEECV